jgi:nitrous oxidase accessory protein
MDPRPPSVSTPSSTRRRLAAALGWTAAGLLLASIFMPYWQIRLFAPQYREGLTATMYAYKVGGDIDEINGLNHYVGVHKLDTLGSVEKLVAVPGILLLAALAALAFRPTGRLSSELKAGAVASYPLIFMTDMKFWMHYASTHLDPTAPIKLKPFSIPLIGAGRVAQFRSTAWPMSGFDLALAAAVLLLIGLWLARREEACAPAAPQDLKKGAALASALILLALAAKPARAESLQALVDAAAPGAIIDLAPGTYAGAVEISKPLTLRGGGRAVIDGGGHGTVVRVTAPGVTLEGLTVRGSGASLLLEDSGVRVNGASATIRGCVLDDVLFGLFVDGVSGTVIEDNVLRGKPLGLGSRGDLLRAWKADRTTFRGNTVSGGRDLVMWFSTGSVVEANTVSGGRYGLHFMYTNGARVVGNSFTDNSVGFYIMYSREVLVEGNRFARHRGPSGMGLGLKESGLLTIRGNIFDSNREGVYIDESPLTPEDGNLFERNLITHNDIGMAILPGVKGNVLIGNSFDDNLEQVSIRGAGTLTGNEWSRAGRGNYWSDYAGYGLAGESTGAVPYRLDGVLEHLLDRTPIARYFLFTPAAAVLELASRAFPIFLPKPILIDEHPLLVPTSPGLPPEVPRQASAPLAAAAGLFMLSGLTAWTASRRNHSRPAAAKLFPAGIAAVSARHVSKSFSARRILDQVSFELAPGSSLVLWGANGAGKSTFIKCLLGLHRHEGAISVFGLDARAHGAEARARIGYVPQHAAGYDWSVAESMEFVCAVRGVDPGGVPAALARVGLTGEEAKSLTDLSGGMTQKLALAQALIAEPDLLVLDEPCANLDLASRREFLSVLRGLKSSRSLLMTSHRLEEVEMIADRVLWLEEGRPARLLDVLDFLAEAEGGRPLWLQLEHEEDCGRAIARLEASGFKASPNGRGVWAEVLPGRTMEAVRALETNGIAVRDLRRGGWS